MADQREQQPNGTEPLVAPLEDRAPHRMKLRGITAAVLVVIVSITFTASTVALWAHRNLLNNEVFSDRVAPLVQDPAVRAALSRRIGDEAVKAIDAKALFASALPERGQILAVPLANAVDGFIQSRVTEFVDSPRFATLWVASTQKAHAAAVALLRGEETDYAGASNGAVTLNLVPIINEVLASIGQQSPEIFGRRVNLPTATVDDAPQAVITRLESALGIDLGDGYGQITVFESDKLGAAQDAIALIDKLTVLLVILTVVLLPLAVWVSPRRRRTVLQLVVGIGLGTVLIRRFSYRLEGDLLDLVRIDENRPGVEAVLGVFLDPLRSACAWILGGLGLVATVAVVTGPYPWAVGLRRGVGRGARAAGDLAVAGAQQARDPKAAAWLSSHRDQFRIAEVAVAVLALLFLDLSWFAILVLAVIIGALELFFARAKPDEEVEPQLPGASPPATPVPKDRPKAPA